jgi:prophage DNA circulation protein
MGSIRDIHNVWRDNLVPASFRGVVFHVETSSRASGRRLVLHQYPKRNTPYAEDMGREAVKWTFSGYLILRDKGIPGNLLTQTNLLILALEADDAGLLIHPSIGTMMVLCQTYSYTDNRQRGGFVQFDMTFVEAGAPVMSMSIVDAVSMLLTNAGAAETQAVAAIKDGTRGMRAG